jgi:CRISPR-associated protein Csm1
MNDHKSTLYKAALLHDIGKFWQRTYNKETYDGTRKEHELLSVEFVETWLQDSEISSIIKNHPKAQVTKLAEGTTRALAAIVCDADRLASSEREDKTSEYKELEKEDPTRFFFHSIFSHIKLPKRKDKIALFKQPLGRLVYFDDAIKYEFPTLETPDKTLTHQYRSQWKALRDKTPKSLSDVHPDTLLYLCKRYLWCVPSAYWYDHPDISLYEHSN